MKITSFAGSQILNKLELNVQPLPPKAGAPNVSGAIEQALKSESLTPQVASPVPSGAFKAITLNSPSLAPKLGSVVIASASEKSPLSPLNLTVRDKSAPVEFRIVKTDDPPRVNIPKTTVTTNRDGSTTTVYDYGGGNKTSITIRKDTSKTIITETNDGKGHKTKSTVNYDSKGHDVGRTNVDETDDGQGHKVKTTTTIDGEGHQTGRTVVDTYTDAQGRTTTTTTTTDRKGHVIRSTRTTQQGK